VVRRERGASELSEASRADPLDGGVLQNRRRQALILHLRLWRARQAKRHLPLKPIRQLEHQDVVRRGAERAAQVAAQLELAWMGMVFTLFGPHQIQRRARPPFPPEDRVQAERLEVEVRIVELIALAAVGGRGGVATRAAVVGEAASRAVERQEVERARPRELFLA